MKTKITLLLIYVFLISNRINAQITIDTQGFNWSKIEDTTPIALDYTDADNGDGLNDGAMLLKSSASTPALQGLQYLLSGSPLTGEQINLEAKYYQVGSSYLKLKMQVYDVTDNVVLGESAVLTTSSGVVGTATLLYTFTASSVGDQIIVRFVRADDLNPVRQAAIDYLKVNGQFISMQAPPIAFDVSDFAWSKIGDVTPVSIVKTDADNGDGLNDGAVLIKGTATTPALQGIQYLLGGTPFANGQINLEVKYWQTASSYCKFKMQVYNVTDNVVLAETAAVTTGSGVVGTLTLSYVFTTSSSGDQIAVRFVRTDDLNTARQAGLDYVKVNGQFINMLPVCKPTFNFDLPLTTATTSEISDLNTIRANLSNQILGTAAPSATALNNAIAAYNALNITITGNTITGNPITSTSQIGFLKTFAQYLKFSPTDTSVSNMAMKAVWYATDQNCNKTNTALTFYNYPTLSRAVVFLNSFLSDKVKNMFGNTLQTETDSFKYLFDPNYDFNTIQTNGAILTDIMYLDIDVLFAYADWFKTDDEKVRYFKTAKRFLDRFLIYTPGTNDGLKKDGLGNHHNNSYDGYMYAYSTVSAAIKSLEGTSFQIDQSSYFRFRDAVYAQTMYSNDAGVKPFAMAGRNPQTKTTTLSSGTLANLAISGGKILGLSSADSVLAGIYNRRYGVNNNFNNSTVTPFEEGYIQFNYGNLGVYRKNNWVASMKGQSDVLWGSEIYASQNRFGRYQSYGALEIIYPGNATTGNGYDVVGWDWNYNPGTTTIVLPWSKLHAERERIDEKNTYGFAGALVLGQANKSVLSKNIGQSGLFAMKFKELSNVGFGITYSPNTHNNTFEFNKTYFAVDDFIICLANGIKNNDATNPTVTTLFQRLNNNSTDVLVNGDIKTNQSTDSFADSSPNWIIDNYNTGYYILPNSGALKIRNSVQTTPYQNQIAPTDSTIASNSSNNYHLAYLDHGVAPTNSSYEFVCIPSASTSRMTTFAQQMQSADKPYSVYQNNANQQIIEHKASKTWAYALPAANATITDGLLKANDSPCLVMYKVLNESSSEIILSVSNPDMGATPSTAKTITLTLNDQWNVSLANPNVSIGSASASGTTVSFTVADGFPVEIKLVRNQETLGTTSQQKETNAVKVFPNPSNSEFEVQLPDNVNRQAQMWITDVAGRLIRTISQTTDDAVRFGGDLHTGVYFLQVVIGGKRTAIKFIKLE
ncbi:Polysaccharide lyase family 8, C-terminal beta-sandwich domain [Pseudarcicella hirudinis]|uniref:Polysaccharide lyase family 8, C-terminal beta-sandwich domain n=1 Tax=Pseudarcicella hirudinis TaxID=1079859 RepID=A0A1I5TWP1_9BACT|nr:polysaccharide lyase family 8 super-sandwich domain-containing protein [Pseudarcicella hirudinis]SFP87017.1 Polysaccharide lyase family 8, C-terminal beta-sandwich domain [Pseudarcicella hirudinis]